MKNLLDYDRFDAINESYSEWRILPNYRPDSGSGLLEVIPDRLQDKARDFLLSIAKNSLEKRLVNSIIDDDGKYSMTVFVRSPKSVVLPIYASYGILRCGQNGSSSMEAFSQLLAELSGKTGATIDPTFSKLIESLPECEVISSSAKTIRISYHGEIWELRYRANSLNVKQGPLHVEVSGNTIDDASVGMASMIKGRRAL